MMTCREARESLGAYVLRTLDVAEAAEVEVHLETCAACREELTELSVLPAFLRRVPRELAVEGPPEPGPNDLMLGRLLRAVSTERRHHRRTQWLSVAAAVVALLLVGVGVAFAVRGGTGPGGAPPVASGPVVTVQPTEDPATNVRGDLTLQSVAWGSKVTMHLSGVAPGRTCSLVAYGANGEQQVAATYKVPEAGYEDTRTFTVDGAIALHAKDVRRVDVVSSGSTLLSVWP